MKEYEVKENELTELRNRLGSEAPRDNLIFGAQRELAIVENQAQQDYIYLCNKYGVDYALKSKEIRNKIRQTNLERYGVDCTLKLEEVKNASSFFDV